MIDPPCPWCQQPNGVSADVEAKYRRPVEGSVSMCAHCGNLSIFSISAFGLILRRATLDEATEIKRHPQYELLLLARAQFNLSPYGYLLL